jgi:cell division septation protein DedD
MAYYTNLTPYVPTPVVGYPGQGEPSAVIGQANRLATPVGPTVGVAVHTAIAPVVSETATADLTPSAVTHLETGVKTPRVEVQSPVIGQAVHTPLITPLGTRPHYKTPTQVWSWDYGNGGGGSGNGGSWA